MTSWVMKIDNAAESCLLPKQVTDNSGASIRPVLTSEQDSGSSFGVGRHVVRYESRDGAGNVASCSFSITVLGKRHM